MEFVGGAERPPRTNEILKAFGLDGRARPVLKRMLRELEDEGRLPGRRRRPKHEGEREGLPNVTVVTVVDVDDEGDLLCRAQQDPQARILLPVEAQEGKAPGPGDRVLARLFPRANGRYDAHLIKLLPRMERAVVGVIEASEDGLRIRPLERSAKLEYRLRPDEAGGASVGDLVRAETLGGDRPMALPQARVTERVGRVDDPGAVSLALAVAAGLPMAFSEAALAEAAKAKPVALGKRRDLRELELVTIDGEDARDFDDAVWAQPDETKGNPGGYRIVVAIADVAHYVRPGSALDREARERGNSVYFPGPGDPDAAGGALERPLLAAAGRGARLLCDPDAHRWPGPADREDLPPLPDALARPAHLYPGPGGAGRAAGRA